MGKVAAPNGTPDNLSVCIRFIRGIRVRLTRTRTRTRMRFLSSFSYSKKTTSGSCRATPPRRGFTLTNFQPSETRVKLVYAVTFIFPPRSLRPCGKAWGSLNEEHTASAEPPASP